MNINTVRSVALVKNRRELIKLRLMRRLAFLERDIYRDVRDFRLTIYVICMFTCVGVCVSRGVGGGVSTRCPQH